MLLSLPDELLSTVAFHLTSGRSTAPGPPSSLPSFLLAHPQLNDACSFDNNPSLYADILHETFDTGAVVRRYGQEVFAEARLAADELKARWALLRRIRQTAQLDAEIPATQDQLKAIADDLMHVFMLLTENDGKNLGHVLEWARLPTYLNHFHQNVMIPMALEPGYPDDTPEKALHVTIAFWLDEAAYFMKQKAYATLSSADEEVDPAASTDEDDFQETPAQIDEKVFVTRPFALALHKFDPYFAPWTAREMPLSKALDLSNPPANDPHLADLRPTRRAVRMSRFQRDYSICPPVLTLSASMGLMNQLDRTPCVGGLSESSSNSSTASLRFLYPFGETPPAAVEGKPFVVDPHTDNVLRQSLPLITLPSRCHDLDVRRLLACGDPWKGGLDSLAFKGKIEGKYHGSFAFFDFAGYRDMLGGDMRTLYEGTFGQQAQQINLSERVVRVHKSLVGGTGPLINAGFPLPGAPSDPYTVCYSEEEQVPEPEGSEYTKEIYVDGTGRSGWGHFKLTGRVRPWDGMITLVKEYTTNDAAGNAPSTRGKWLYRGYIMQDSRFVGCWRDSFTDCSFRGYEGSFHLRKQTDEYLAPLTAAAAGASKPLPAHLASYSTLANTDPNATSRPEADSAEGLVFSKDDTEERGGLQSSSMASPSPHPEASFSYTPPTSLEMSSTPAPSFEPSWFAVTASHASSSSRLPPPPPTADTVSTTSGVGLVTTFTADIDPARLADLCPSSEAESTDLVAARTRGRGEISVALSSKGKGKAINQKDFGVDGEVEKGKTRQALAEAEAERGSGKGRKRKRAVPWTESWGEVDPAEWSRLEKGVAGGEEGLSAPSSPAAAKREKREKRE